MASFYSGQYQDAYVDVPSDKLAPGTYAGMVKSMVYTWTPAAEIDVTDTLYLGKLPAGARVLSFFSVVPATGATGQYDIGYQANGVDDADLDGFVDGIDPGAAAVAAFGVGTKIGKKFTVETTVVLTPAEITATATAVAHIFIIQYVVD